MTGDDWMWVLKFLGLWGGLAVLVAASFCLVVHPSDPVVGSRLKGDR